MSDKLHINKIRILELPSKQYQGEAYYRGQLIVTTIKYLNKANCIKVLNCEIDKYNYQNKTQIPLMKSDGKEIIYEVKDKQAVSSKPKSASTAKAEPKAEPKPTKPKRKPFTPYGLNGYLVDKQGNVRLMLDRRANAQTIVLTPEMFSSLAEMVKKTQEQHNAST